MYPSTQSPAESVDLNGKYLGVVEANRSLRRTHLHDMTYCVKLHSRAFCVKQHSMPETILSRLQETIPSKIRSKGI